MPYDVRSQIARVKTPFLSVDPPFEPAELEGTIAAQANNESSITSRLLRSPLSSENEKTGSHLSLYSYKSLHQNRTARRAMSLGKNRNRVKEGAISPIVSLGELEMSWSHQYMMRDDRLKRCGAQNSAHGPRNHAPYRLGPVDSHVLPPWSRFALMGCGDPDLDKCQRIHTVPGEPVDIRDYALFAVAIHILPLSLMGAVSPSVSHCLGADASFTITYPKKLTCPRSPPARPSRRGGFKPEPTTMAA